MLFVWHPLLVAGWGANNPICVAGFGPRNSVDLQNNISLERVKFLKFLSKVRSDSLSPSSVISSVEITIKSSVFVALSNFSEHEISVLVCLFTQK